MLVLAYAFIIMAITTVIVIIKITFMLSDILTIRSAKTIIARVPYDGTGKTNIRDEVTSSITVKAWSKGTVWFSYTLTVTDL